MSISQNDFQEVFASLAESVRSVHVLNVGYDNTNDVYHVITKNQHEYIVKIQKNTDIQRTQFWKGLNVLFKKTIVDSIYSQKALSVFLQALHNITVPDVVKVDPTNNNPLKKPYVIMTKVEGAPVLPESNEAEEIAKNKDIAYQLGLFLSKVHAQSFDYFGNPSGEGWALTEFPNKLASTIKILAASEKALSHPKIRTLLPHYLSLASNHPPLERTGIIMLDLWPIQFLLGQNTLAALIDLESYVVGPIGLELTLIEFWLGNLRTFKQGYMSEGAQWPNFEEQRDLYRFFLYLLYDCPIMGLDACLNSAAKFPVGERVKGRIEVPRPRPRPDGYNSPYGPGF